MHVSKMGDIPWLWTNHAYMGQYDICMCLDGEHSYGDEDNPCMHVKIRYIHMSRCTTFIWPLRQTMHACGNTIYALI